ncbi:MAG: hypothetical protein AAGD28_15060 [Bacteroidota bacterium]
MQIPKSAYKIFIEVSFYLSIALLLLVLYKTAWLSDDAFITYRYLDNFIQGEGLTFNKGHRVQAYTHPLWLFIHLPLYFLFDNIYYVGLIISCLFSLLAIYFFLNSLALKEPKIYALLLIISSTAFIDFSSSGLENPLTHILLISISIRFLSEDNSPIKSLYISLIAALMVLNRMDSILLILPLLLMHAWANWEKRRIFYLLIGMLPFLLWEIFALIYYGFLFPMTAYAKLNISLSRWQLMEQGFYYMEDLLTHDPLTSIVILAALVLSFRLKEKKFTALALGIVLHLIYLFFIGGDFMRGRFFSAPFFLGLFILFHASPISWLRRAMPFFLLLGILSSSPPLMSSEKFGSEVKENQAETTHGILDERAFYFQKSGLIATKKEARPSGYLVDMGHEINQHRGKFFIAGALGMLSYFAGPEKHIIDSYALTDPFLAQLPNVYQSDWRPGHNKRLIPKGLIESYTSGRNMLENPKLKELYGKIKIITQDAIWSWDRFQTIVDMNLSKSYQHLIDRKHFHLPISFSISEIELKEKPQRSWELYGDMGLEIKLQEKRALRLIEILSEGECEFTFIFLRDNQLVEARKIGPAKEQQDTLRHTFSAPIVPINRILIYPNTQSHPCQIYRLRF